MKILVTGAGGQLGRAVQVTGQYLGGLEVKGFAHGELAVEDAVQVRAAVDSAQPDLVVHCAAWTEVDACEADPARADLINGVGTENVADACAAANAGLVYVSSDFVFSGDAESPYKETAATAPVSAYGRSKLLGEEAVLSRGADRFWVVRTSWVFGPGGKNFPRAILNAAKAGKPLHVVDDQLGSPTMTLDLARAILDLASAEGEPGVYHAANEGACSWYDFARATLDLSGMAEVPVARMSSVDLDRPARRPSYSVLDCSRLTKLRGQPMPHYHDALKRYLDQELDSP